MEGVSLLAIIGMVFSESAQVGLMIASKEALSDGMTNLVFMVYSNAIASLILLPSSLLFHRSSQRPKLTFSVLCGFFLLGLIGCGVQFLGYTGIYYSSPTLCTAMLNLIPTFTFVLAVALRMEVFHWRSSISLAKSIGTVVSLLGAFLVTFYDGPALLRTFSSYPKLFSEHSNWVFGGLLLVVVAVLSSFWLIIQASILKRYPEELVMVFFYFFFVCILSVMVCLVVERDLSAWSLKSKTRLWCVLYSGAFGSAFQIGINTWCMNKVGPVFVTMFKPLGIVISVFVGVVFSGDTFYLGRFLGAAIIIVGFYSVLWAKSKEAKIGKGNEMIESLESTTQHVPLLRNRSEEQRSVSQ